MPSFLETVMNAPTPELNPQNFTIHGTQGLLIRANEIGDLELTEQYPAKDRGLGATGMGSCTAIIFIWEARVLFGHIQPGRKEHTRRQMMSLTARYRSLYMDQKPEVQAYIFWAKDFQNGRWNLVINTHDPVGKAMIEGWMPRNCKIKEVQYDKNFTVGEWPTMVWAEGLGTPQVFMKESGKPPVNVT